MDIKRILVSQPAPSAEKSPFTELTTRYNVEVVYRPFIEIEGVTTREFRAQKVRILDHTAVIMTSRSSIDHYFRICEASRTIVPDGMKFFCVSESVANYLQKYITYRKRKIFFASGTFISLIDIIAKHKEETYLVPLSDPHKAEIPTLLNKSGVKYTPLILSRTVATDLRDVDPCSFDILVLYSPADVKSFTTNFCGVNCKSKIAVFGNGTACAALEAGLDIDIMSPTPEFPSMVMALSKYISCYNSQGDVSAFKLTTMPVIIQAEPTPIPKRKRSTSKGDCKVNGCKVEGKEYALKSDAKVAAVKADGKAVADKNVTKRVTNSEPKASK